MLEYEIARRTPRFRFAVDVTVIDIEHKIDIKARTSTLGLFGCGIATSKPFIQGTGVRVRMSYRGAGVKAIGIVAYVRPNLDMGIAFTDIDRESERILALWIEELTRYPAGK